MSTQTGAAVEPETCGRACMGTARRKPTSKPRKQTVAPPPAAPRIENGVWRPNAPGWPAQPHIPAHLRPHQEK